MEIRLPPGVWFGPGKANMYLLINQCKVGQEAFLEKINISYVSHIFPRRRSSSQLHLGKVPFLISAGQLHQRYRNTCFLKRRDLHSVYWQGLAWKPYRESIDALETLYQARICSLAAERRFEHMCKFATKTLLVTKNSDSFFE